MSKLEALKAAVTSKAARQLLVAQKHSPQALFAIGVAGVVTATVLACRGTLKLEEVLTHHEEDVKDLHDMKTQEVITPEQHQKETVKLQLKTAGKIAKLYGPAIGLGALSIASLTGSHVILTRRNTAVMAAAAAVQKGYDQYRSRVVEEFGEEKDRELANGFESRKVSEKMADGSTKETEEKVVTNHGGLSPYATTFDERSKKFSTVPGQNFATLMTIQNYATDKLRNKGHLFLNELYDMLCLPRTKAGQAVGWLYENAGDYVSLGVFDGEEEWVEAFVDGVEKYAVINPNVDGVIWDKI